MSMQNDIVEEMRSTKDSKRKAVLKILVAEFQRSLRKEISDETVIKIIKACIKNEQLVCSHLNENDARMQEAEYSIEVLQSLLVNVKTVSIDEVREWVSKNIDFSVLPNKMAAMKVIMFQFKGLIDGGEVKKLLESM